MVLVYFMEVKEKSSHYGLNMLGYTCATKAKTVRCDGEVRSKALKIVPSAKEGKNIKHKILERLESYNDESTNLDKGYSDQLRPS